MRRFELHRDVDVSGVSGIGVVAEGVAFTDGTAVVHWKGEHASTVVWPSIESVEHIHGHGGATRLVWKDADETAIADTYFRNEGYPRRQRAAAARIRVRYDKLNGRATPDWIKKLAEEADE